MALPDFDESTIRALATDASYYRGEEYYEFGAVRNLVLEGDGYGAQVYGMVNAGRRSPIPNGFRNSSRRQP